MATNIPEWPKGYPDMVGFYPMYSNPFLVTSTLLQQEELKNKSANTVLDQLIKHFNGTKDKISQDVIYEWTEMANKDLQNSVRDLESQNTLLKELLSKMCKIVDSPLIISSGLKRLSREYSEFMKYLAEQDKTK